MNQTYPIHHETVVARLAPEDADQEGRFDILQTAPKTFQVIDGGAVPADEETTLAKALKSARRLAAAYDRDARAARRRKAANRLYATSVTIAVKAGSEVEATARIASVLDASGTIANWHFRTFGADATFVTLPRAVPAGKGLTGNLDTLAPHQGILTPKLRAAIAKLADEVRAHLDYESDADMEAALETLDQGLAEAETHQVRQ